MAVRREGLPPLPCWQRWYDDLLVGTMARVSHTGEEIDHELLLLRTSWRISEQGGARSHWWVRSPDGDAWEEDMQWHRSWCMPFCDPRGSRIQKWMIADDGAGSELIPQTESCWIGYQRLVISPPIVEPANVVLLGVFFLQPCRLSFQLDHLHVTENWNEP